MRIQAINYQQQVYNRQQSSVKSNNTKNSVSTTSQYMTSMPNYSYGMDLVHKKSNNVAFTGGADDVTKAGLALLKQFPVEERLATLFKGLKHGEIILLGKNYNEAQKALTKNVQGLKQAIKKEIFMPENTLQRNYAFLKNSLGDIELLNVNDKKIILTTGGKKYFLDPGQSFYVVNNDTVQIANDVLHIKETPKYDLSSKKAGFSTVYDFEKNMNNELAALNKRTLAQTILHTTRPVEKQTFSKIGGQDKVIEELKKGILYPIKYPSAYGAEDITRGYILHGPAGTGKTALCKALANEAGVNCDYVSGTAFQAKYVGESEANVRAFFDKLRDNQPSIGIIDEIDAIGAERGDVDKYGNKLIDQLLTCITDLYDEGDNVYILGLTNKYDMLDSALKRSERLSKHILVDAPDRSGVETIFKIYTDGKNLDKDVDVNALVDKMYADKVVGSDIKYITKLARENMMRRLGIFEKMENNTYVDADMANPVYKNEDFLVAIKQFKDQHRKSSRNPIGFNK